MEKPLPEWIQASSGEKLCVPPTEVTLEGER